MAVSFTYFPLISQKETLSGRPPLGDSFCLKCKPRGKFSFSLCVCVCVWQALRRPAKDLPGLSKNLVLAGLLLLLLLQLLGELCNIIFWQCQTLPPNDKNDKLLRKSVKRGKVQAKVSMCAHFYLGFIMLSYAFISPYPRRSAFCLDH